MVQAGAVTKIGRSSTADIVSNKSVTVLKAFDIAVGNKFSGRMKMYLKGKLPTGVDMTYSFTYKWSHLMEAFDDTLGSDSHVKYLTTFVNDKDDHVGGKVVDQALHAIDNIIDELFGALDKEFTDRYGSTVSTKYIKRSIKFFMAFKDVVVNLPSGCNLIKPYLSKTLTQLYKQPRCSSFFKIPTHLWMRKIGW